MNQKEWPLDTDQEIFIEVLLIDLMQSPRYRDRSVQNQDDNPSGRLESASFRRRLHDCTVEMSALTVTASPLPMELIVGGLLRSFFVGGVVYDNERAVLSKTLGNGRTDAHGGTSNGCNLVSVPQRGLCLPDYKRAISLGGAEADEKRVVVSPVQFIHHLIRRLMGDEMRALVQRPSVFPVPGLSQL